MKKFALSIILSGALVSPAAAATISFTANTTSLPSYTTATVVEGFEQPGQTPFNFTANLTNTRGTETLNLNGGSALILSDNILTDMVGKYLLLWDRASYTLNFGSSPVQFLSFLVDNYNSDNRVNITYSNGTTVTNVLSGLAGLSNNRDGLVAFNQEGGLGISAVQFVAANNRLFAIDQIAAAAPEPATWGMMLVGFGFVGTQMRRRRRKSAIAIA